MSKDRSVPPIAPHRTSFHRLTAVAVLLAVLPLAACGTPPELRPSGKPATPRPTGIPTTTPATPPTGGVTPPPAPPPTTPATIAGPCRSGPSGDRVIALLRGRVLPRAVRVRVRTGPLCADDWQYTVLGVTGHEELQVITRGSPGALALVTAGTDPCTIEVRATAPAGIRTLACDGGTVAVPGA